jgi:hypothetical protein
MIILHIINKDKLKRNDWIGMRIRNNNLIESGILFDNLYPDEYKLSKRIIFTSNSKGISYLKKHFPYYVVTEDNSITVFRVDDIKGYWSALNILNKYKSKVMKKYKV